MKRIILLFLATATLMGCGLFDSGSQRITGRYIVLWIDLPANQTIAEESEINSSSCTGIIPEYVFAAGHNDKYIIAKQHPTSGFKGGYKINVSTTNYYIVDIHCCPTKK